MILVQKGCPAYNFKEARVNATRQLLPITNRIMASWLTVTAQIMELTDVWKGYGNLNSSYLENASTSNQRRRYVYAQGVAVR